MELVESKNIDKEITKWSHCRDHQTKQCYHCVKNEERKKRMSSSSLIITIHSHIHIWSIGKV
jgi:hypothetical protein